MNFASAVVWLRAGIQKTFLSRYAEAWVGRLNPECRFSSTNKISQLHERGYNTDAIARSTGYSVVTVERNIRTRGEDPRTGPQCEQYFERVFSVDEALVEMPLPCADKCVCSWRPILPSDLRQKGN